MFTRLMTFILIGLLTASAAFAEPFNPENALWEIFTYTGNVTSIVYSDDGSTLWVGTIGGLEERDSHTGQRLRLYTNLDGLPSNNINALLTDGSGGLWIATYGGLAHLSATNEWTVYNEEDSGLPNDWVETLISDDSGGLWIGTYDGLTHLSSDGEWIVYNIDNSGLPENFVYSLTLDPSDGLWIGTWGGGLAHFSDMGKWTVYNEDNSGLSDNLVKSLLIDGDSGDLWIGTYGGLALLSASGEWTVYSEENSRLPSNMVNRLISDGFGGIWIGIGDDMWEGGLARLSASGEWTVYNEKNSKLPDNDVLTLLTDHSGGIWVGTDNGLARLAAMGDWTLHNGDNSRLPDNNILSFTMDRSGRIWMGTENGLVSLSATDDWGIYTVDNSKLPDNMVYALASDGSGGIWIGTARGLAHISASGEWNVYTVDNSSLTNNNVVTLVSDNAGNIWLGMSDSWEGDGGLARLSATGEWCLYTVNNSSLPDNSIYTLASDGSGGVWIGTSEGLSRLSASGEWTVYNANNSGLLSNNVKTITSDGSGGLWIATFGGGFSHLSATSAWSIYNVENSKLPDNDVWCLAPDGSGGVWIGTVWSGLVHLSASGEWNMYDVKNSGLPDNWVNSLISDGSGGLWVGTFYGGLSHLGFGYKSELPDLPQGERAAIVIFPKGKDRNDTFALETMASYAYRTLQQRGFDNDEIYFLSHTPVIDINADAIPDFGVVDAPVTLEAYRKNESEIPESLIPEDVAAAFSWAKEKGRLTHPLYVIFTGHGLPGRLRLDDFNSMLDVAVLNTMVTDYQEYTGNQVVLVIEACHSGTLVKELAYPGRVIITSTGENQAFYSDNGRGSFSRLFLSELYNNSSFYDAFKTVSEILPAMKSPFDEQIPQIEDDGDGIANRLDGDVAGQLHLNGDFRALGDWVSLKAVTEPHHLTAGEALHLEVEVSYTESRLEVWALILTPEYVQQRDSQGYFLHPAPRVNLSSSDGITYEGNFTGVHYGGDYVVTFHAKDNNGFISSSSSLTFTLNDGPAATATPVPSQPLYHEGDPITITIPHAPSNDITQYVAVVVPGIDSLLLLTSQNEISKFEGVLHPFGSSGDYCVDLPDVVGLPKGTYTVFLLRAPDGYDPLKMDAADWLLGQATFEVY